jgi:polyribonucleotide nucleotidyltransferase
LHISEISNERVKEVKDYLQEGQIVRVKLLAADEAWSFAFITQSCNGR